ncbi:MAG: hypothetical protein ABJP34_11810 [Erythrobacter sp.]
MGISWKVILLIVGISTLTLRALLDSTFATTTLVYIAVPFAISVVLAFFTKENESRKWGARYLNHMRNSTIVFLATSVVLFEGFLCVLMFMPIYYVFVSVGFAFVAGFSEKDPENRDLTNTFKAYGLPVLVLMMVGEGLVPATTVERAGTATYVSESPLSVAQLQANMARPIAFDSERHWFLKLFPLPDQIHAGSLTQGDLHRLHFTYKRWIFTNAHKGEMHVKIAKVSDQHIRTEITRNDSYLANYMRIDGTDVRFTPQPSGKTRVSVSVRYERRLDPAWYFGSMQHLAAEQSAKLFLSDIIFRHEAAEVPVKENGNGA